MRFLLALLAVLGLSALPAAAVDFSDPAAVVEAAYAPYVAGDDFDWSAFDGAEFRSAGLNALYAKDSEEADGEVGRLDFDPLINGQDYAITKLQIGAPELSGTTATVEVTFENFEHPEKMHVVLVREGGGYKIDDVQSLDPEYPYSLRGILEAPMP